MNRTVPACFPSPKEKEGTERLGNTSLDFHGLSFPTSSAFLGKGIPAWVSLPLLSTLPQGQLKEIRLRRKGRA